MNHLQQDLSFVQRSDLSPMTLTILGSGPAGLTAALYACRAGITTQLFCGPEVGGQLTTTSMIENWPGGGPNLTGPALMTHMEEQVRRYPVTIHYEEIIRANFSAYPFRLWTKNKIYQTEAVIIATGARARYLGFPSEKEYFTKGVSACATCDGFFYRNKKVAVVGGGNSALEEALYLSDLASQVHLIHRRNAFRAEQILQDRLQKKVSEGKIILHTPYCVQEVLGNGEEVTGLRLSAASKEAALTEKTLDLSALFVAIGREPCSKWCRDQILTDEEGFILTQEGSELKTATSIAGVFAAGDIVKGAYRQAITAAASGCMAALDVKRFLDARIGAST